MKEKMIKILNTKYSKRILLVVLIIGCMCLSSFATANILLTASEVEYEKENGTKVSVDGALNELYSMATEAQTFKSGLNATTAETGDLLSGKTAYKLTRNGDNVTTTLLTGTMANRGAVTASINPGGSYTIPQGYHDGTGVITANKSGNAIPEVVGWGMTCWTSAGLIKGKNYVASYLTNNGELFYTYGASQYYVENSPKRYTVPSAGFYLYTNTDTAMKNYTALSGMTLVDGPSQVYDPGYDKTSWTSTFYASSANAWVEFPYSANSGMSCFTRVNIR